MLATVYVVFHCNSLKNLENSQLRKFNRLNDKSVKSFERALYQEKLDNINNYCESKGLLGGGFRGSNEGFRGSFVVSFKFVCEQYMMPSKYLKNEFSAAEMCCTVIKN